MRPRPRTAASRVRRYRGTNGATRKAEAQLTPVTADRPACPECGGGVRIVRSVVTNTAEGLVYGQTRVYGSHAYGGGGATYGVTCPGSGRKYTE